MLYYDGRTLGNHVVARTREQVEHDLRVASADLLRCEWRVQKLKHELADFSTDGGHNAG